MFRMIQGLWNRGGVVACGVMLTAPWVYAQEFGGAGSGSNIHTENERGVIKSQSRSPSQLHLSCILQGPGQVQRFRVTCNGINKVDVKTADCCIEGDHWQLKVKQWDNRPNTAVTTSPGGSGVFGVVGRVYTYSSQTDVDALVECSYLHGVNVFPAETDILVEHHGGRCAVTDLGLSNEIDRTP